MTEPSDERVLVITRVFEALPELVWRAWTDSEMALKWAGPRDYPAVSIQGEVKPGGAWRTILHDAATGADVAQGGVYKEVVENRRLSFTFAWDHDRGTQDMMVTLTFEDIGGKTKFTLRQEPFNTVADRDGHNGGWNSTFDRLDDVLAAQRA